MTAHPGGSLSEASAEETIFPYVWTWGICSGCPLKDAEGGCGFPQCPGKYPELGKRRGRRCRILARGAKNSVHLEFDDGYKTITSANGLRRAKGASHAS